MMRSAARFVVGICVIGVICAIRVAAQPGELIERTLAIVGGQVITLADTRATIALALIDIGKPADSVDGATTLLVERELILREVQRYAPPEPAASAIDARVESVRQRFPDADTLNRTLESTGFSDVRLRAWVRDDLRIQAYLSQRFAAAGVPTEQEIALAFTSRRAEFEKAGTSFEQAAPLLREQLSAARRKELIADWVADLRRRTEVVLLK
ncbi:MAG: hypothetical protein ACRD2N_13380 [Vicinamibacterales bacterium]